MEPIIGVLIIAAIIAGGFAYAKSRKNNNVGTGTGGGYSKDGKKPVDKL